MQDQTQLSIQGLTKSFQRGKETVTVLDGIDLQLKSGDSVAVIGPSGSGKSTLLHIVGTLDRPDQGQVLLQDQDPFALSEPELAKFRNEVVGFIFQDHHLLPQYTVLENVLLPTFAIKRDSAEDRARMLLDRVGLGHRLQHRPAELSGGERQRTAIARALINEPRLLLCDEPTGNLDQNTANQVAELLFELHRESNSVLIIVTHAMNLAEMCAKQCQLQKGKLLEKSQA